MRGSYYTLRVTKEESVLEEMRGNLQEAAYREFFSFSIVPYDR